MTDTCTDDMERCGRCGEKHDELQEENDGGLICPPCIMKEAARHRDKRRMHRNRIERRYSEAERNGSGWPR